MNKPVIVRSFGYNGSVKITRKILLLLSLVLIINLSAFRLQDDEPAPTGYDLAAAVNAYRASMGYYQLSYNSLVASAAQTHAEWIVSTGQGGHTGAYGSDETVRVSWTGYGGGASIQCDECWASGQSVESAVYNAWSDWVHQEVMLNAWGNMYTDIGGGVASQGNGRYVFILNVCKVVGQEYDGTTPSSNDTNPAANDGIAVVPTADTSQYIYGVTAATPMSDGTIKHTVLYGQSLAAIAEAYGVTIDEIRELNDMAADDSTIWVDQELLIKQGTGEAPAEETATPEAEELAAEETEPEATEKPAGTPTSVIRSTSTPLPRQTATATSSAGETNGENGNSGFLSDAEPAKLIGILMVSVSGLGLLIFVYFSFFKK